MADNYKATPIASAVRQSPPVDLSQPYDADWLKDRHIIITGGASGFGAGFAREWAAHGASVVIGDINVESGLRVAADIRKKTNNAYVHFFRCDVTDWQSQVEFFRHAVMLSPHGGIDVVVANAGVAGMEPLHEPGNLDAPEPPKPNFSVVDVNLYGVLYTTQLALYWLPKNPRSKPCTTDVAPAGGQRDRCLLLVGSMASLGPIAMNPLYGAAKHGVLGLFRSLRISSFIDGVRCNMICPYFVETGIMPVAGRLLLAGGALGKIEDVVDAATRLTADSRIMGRALMIGPKANVKQTDSGDWTVVGKAEAGGEEKAIWEAYADDFEDCEAFTYRIVRVLNGYARAKGWAGWFVDVVSALRYALGF